MLDFEIIKALECCVSTDNINPDCDNCPYDGDDLLRPCNHNLMKDAISLINRQKAEIKVFNITYNEIKAEVIKEFANRLKDKHRHNTTSIVSLVTVFDNINKLVKEMTEAK